MPISMLSCCFKHTVFFPIPSIGRSRRNPGHRESAAHKLEQRARDDPFSSVAVVTDSTRLVGHLLRSYPRRPACPISQPQVAESQDRTVDEMAAQALGIFLGIIFGPQSGCYLQAWRVRWKRLWILLKVPLHGDLCSIFKLKLNIVH